VSFAREQINRLAASGWNRCASVARAIAAADLPAPTVAYLNQAVAARQWTAAERTTAVLAEHFGSARFAEETTFGLLLVPDPGKLDTRRPMASDVRRDHLGHAAEDVFDDRRPAGALLPSSGHDWTLVATVTGAYGVSTGSYHAITRASADEFTAWTVDVVERRPVLRVKAPPDAPDAIAPIAALFVGSRSGSVASP